MQLSQSTSMRMDQRQMLTPRMIQSMEILQLPLMALEERIEQELTNNPVLEMREKEGEPGAEQTQESVEAHEDYSEGEQTLTMKEDASEDFDRLARISDYFENEEFSTNGSSSSFRQSSYDGERDKKLDAMNNTASRGVNLQEHLLGEWAFIDCTPAVRAAGEAIINNIDGDGYLRRDGQALPLEEIQKESKNAARDSRPGSGPPPGANLGTRRRGRSQSAGMPADPTRSVGRR